MTLGTPEREITCPLCKKQVMDKFVFGGRTTFDCRNCLLNLSNTEALLYQEGLKDGAKAEREAIALGIELDGLSAGHPERTNSLQVAKLILNGTYQAIAQTKGIKKGAPPAGMPDDPREKSRDGNKGGEGKEAERSHKEPDLPDDPQNTPKEEAEVVGTTAQPLLPASGTHIPPLAALPPVALDNPETERKPK